MLFSVATSTPLPSARTRSRRPSSVSPRCRSSSLTASTASPARSHRTCCFAFSTACGRSRTRLGRLAWMPRRKVHAREIPARSDPRRAILVAVKLAEALSLRSDAQKRLAQLQARATASARYQEGEEPAEDAADLLAQA